MATMPVKKLGSGRLKAWARSNAIWQRGGYYQSALVHPKNSPKMSKA